MKKSTLILSILSLLIIFAAGLVYAKQIHVTITVENGSLVCTPPGPISYTTGDVLVVHNDTEYTLDVKIKSASGYVLHGAQVWSGAVGYFPLATGYERKATFTAMQCGSCPSEDLELIKLVPVEPVEPDPR